MSLRILVFQATSFLRHRSLTGEAFFINGRSGPGVDMFTAAGLLEHRAIRIAMLFARIHADELQDAVRCLEGPR